MSLSPNFPVPPMVGNTSYILPVINDSLAVKDLPNCTIAPLSQLGICDLNLSIHDRASSLVGALTLREKINNSIFYMPGVERLGLPPATLWNEALHGLAFSLGSNWSENGEWSHATSFPMPILTAAAFDDDLVYAVADVISTEVRAFANAGHSGFSIWTPNVNPFRDPRWGRGAETPGEDAFRVSEYASAFLSGLQGPKNSPHRKVVGTCKHATGNDIEKASNNITRYNFDAKISIQDQADYYLRPFERCARDAGAESLMCAYNAVNGVPQCADKWMMETLLRGHWGWAGLGRYITSDCFALDVMQLAREGHGYTATTDQTLSESLKAGTDTECGAMRLEFLAQAIQDDPSLEKHLDQSLERIYESFLKLGLFDPIENQPYRHIGWGDVNTPASQRLALRAATSGITLLKNRNQTLPLKISDGNRLSVALVGDWVNATKQMQGGYFGIAPFLISPLEAFSKEKSISVKPVLSLDNELITEAVKDSDVIVYVGGIDTGVEAEALDRVSLAWNSTQIELIQRLSTLSKPFVLVQTGGGQLDDSAWLEDNGVSAILWAGYPGQSGGQAIVDIIFGRTAPAGRLPVTQFAADYASVPQTVMGLRPDPQQNNLGQTYQWYTGQPVLPFGYGLHYTSFDVSLGRGGLQDKKLDIAKLMSTCSSRIGPADQCILGDFSVQVENTGIENSDYVVLAFVSGSNGPPPHPNKVLAAYKRIHDINPGKRGTALLEVKLAQLARFDSKGRRMLYPGTYRIGIDVSPERLSFEFVLTGEPVVLEIWPAYDREAPVGF